MTSSQKRSANAPNEASAGVCKRAKPLDWKKWQNLITFEVQAPALGSALVTSTTKERFQVPYAMLQYDGHNIGQVVKTLVNHEGIVYIKNVGPFNFAIFLDQICIATCVKTAWPSPACLTVAKEIGDLCLRNIVIRKRWEHMQRPGNIVYLKNPGKVMSLNGEIVRSYESEQGSAWFESRHMFIMFVAFSMVSIADGQPRLNLDDWSRLMGILADKPWFSTFAKDFADELALLHKVNAMVKDAEWVVTPVEYFLVKGPIYDYDELTL